VFLLFVTSNKIYLSCVFFSFHDAVITNKYTTSNNGVNDEEGQGYGIIEVGYYPDIWFGGTDGNHGKVGQDRGAQMLHQSSSRLTGIGARRVM